jgi:type I restriction enzyme R subunit
MSRNETATRAELVDPALARSGWGQDSSSRINYEFQITLGRKQIGNKRSPAQIADYLLESRGQHLAIIEAKKYDAHVTEGLAQAKAYAEKMAIRFAYSTNGREIYAADLTSGREALVDAYPTPKELWEMTFAESNLWRDRFLEIPDERRGGLWQPRYYQDIAINKVLDEIANGKRRILLTLATGTGKTAIAFQVSWKLFQTRWNLSGEPTRRPRILFLADRNILADQAYNAFGAFPEDAMERIKPADVKKAGSVPKNASIFFTIFQTFLTESTGEVNYGQYPSDFFDFIVIDECHRGGANDESTWRKILEYFEPAVQLGLTATPRRDINIDTYKYFGEPVYSYSLKDGIEDGFLTPFRVRQFNSTIDEYIYTPDDIVLEGEVEPGRVYTEIDFNRLIFIEERERLRVKLFMDEIGTNDKTLVFCANQNHALTIRDLINQHVQPKDADFCVRVTANDGATGEEFLRKFQDNDKTVPTILTTSHKLSTGIDALNVRNIVLLRPIKSMIEFKQIIGRGTRLFEGKDYFTVYDFVEAYKHFSDPDWDGEPLEPGGPVGREATSTKPTELKPPQQRIVIKLRDGKERAIQHMTQTMFMGPDGRPMTAQDFIKELFGTLTMPEFFSSEEELRLIWSDPVTRRALLGRLTEAGFPIDELREVQKLIDAQNSDLFDVLEYVAYAKEPVSRLERALATRPQLQGALSPGQVDFIHFVLDRYVETGFEELDDARLPELIKLKYEGIHEGVEALGGTDQARRVFIDFQRHLYATG